MPVNLPSDSEGRFTGIPSRRARYCAVNPPSTTTVEPVA